MIEDVFFINRDGEKISSDTIASHIGLANAIIGKSKMLQEEYQRSGRIDPVDFLVSDKGYLKLTSQSYYRRCVYSSSKISERQRKLIAYYCEEGYALDDNDFNQYIERLRE